MHPLPDWLVRIGEWGVGMLALLSWHVRPQPWLQLVPGMPCWKLCPLGRGVILPSVPGGHVLQGCGQHAVHRLVGFVSFVRGACAVVMSH